MQIGRKSNYLKAEDYFLSLQVVCRADFYPNNSLIICWHSLVGFQSTLCKRSGVRKTVRYCTGMVPLLVFIFVVHQGCLQEGIQITVQNGLRLRCLVIRPVILNTPVI